MVKEIMKLDMRIKNGRVIDPASGIDQIMDLGVLGGKLVDIQGRDVVVGEEMYDIDARGCLVLPGLIDYHVHAFGKGSGLGIPHPDLLLSAGVTAVVDAGSAGCATFESFYQTTILNTQVKTKCYLNAYTGGQLDDLFAEDFNPDKFNEKWIARLREKYSDTILGLKLRTSSFIVKELGIKPLVAIKDMCRRLGDVSLCVHITDPPFEMEKMADLLDPGDVFCHMYGYGDESILDANGKIKPAVLAARERGVIFDAANGRNNFSFAVAIPALAEGFFPDIISTDVTREKLFLPPYVKNLPSLLSKYKLMGLPLEKTIPMVTVNPAAAMGCAGELGTLAPGTCADITVLKEIEKEVTYMDSRGETLTGKDLLVTQMTIVDGVALYSAGDFHV